MRRMKALRLFGRVLRAAAVMVMLLVLGVWGLVGCATSYETHLAAGHPDVPAGLSGELRRTVSVLSEDIGERNCYRTKGLERAAAWIEGQLRDAGLKPVPECFNVPRTEVNKLPADRPVRNIYADVTGTTQPNEIIVIGGHYDSRIAHQGWHDHERVLPDNLGTPGANDNASGVAATLALAGWFHQHPQNRTLRFYFWVNEEPPFYQTDQMGSRVSARLFKQTCASEKLVSAISFDAVGCYSAQPQTKRRGDYLGLPSLIGLPARADYAAFLSVKPNGPLMDRCARVFSQHSRVAVRQMALPDMGKIVAWSDDWSFKEEKFPAFCVTDTAYLRSDHYHELSDKIEHMDFVPFAEVVWGMRFVIEDLANH